MNSHNKKPGDGDFYVPIFPEDESYQARRRHWLFWFNRDHTRRVRVRPIRMPNGVFSATYSDPKRGIEFIDHASAEHYLGQNISLPTYVGQTFARRVRDAHIHFVCTKCGHIGCEETEVTFEGPFNMVTAKTVTTTSRFPCPKCKEEIKDAEISTARCSDQPTDADCEWNP